MSCEHATTPSARSTAGDAASEGQLHAEIVGQLVGVAAVLHAGADRAEDVPVVGDVVDPADRDAGRGLAPRDVGGLVEKLGAQGEPLRHLARYAHADIAVILVAGARIDPVATAAEHRPVAE